MGRIEEGGGGWGWLEEIEGERDLLCDVENGGDAAAGEAGPVTGVVL